MTLSKKSKWKIGLRNPFYKHRKPTNFIENEHSRHPESIMVPTVKMYITVHQAVGGYVIEWNVNDNEEGLGKVHSSLHLISSNEDLGQSISNIITLEMLRK